MPTKNKKTRYHANGEQRRSRFENPDLWSWWQLAIRRDEVGFVENLSSTMRRQPSKTGRFLSLWIAHHGRMLTAVPDSAAMRDRLNFLDNRAFWIPNQDSGITAAGFLLELLDSEFGTFRREKSRCPRLFNLGEDIRPTLLSTLKLQVNAEHVTRSVEGQ